MELSGLSVRRQMPGWFRNFRPHQVLAIDSIMEAYESGIKLVILDAPTGSGKTLIAEAVRRLLDARGGLYVCSTKTLQDQFMHDYDYAALLKGRANYETFTDGVTAADCTKTGGEGTGACAWCPAVDLCPYEIAKARALASALAVINTAYALTEWNYVGKFAGRDLSIIDEADTLEGGLMNFVEVDISAGRVEQLGLGEPAKVTKPEAWLEWIERAIPIVRDSIPRVEADESSLEIIREARYLSSLVQQLTRLRKDVDGWVYTGKNGRVAFKPVTVDTLAPTMLWKHCSRWLLMSATVISPEEMVKSLGWNGPWEYVSVPSTFPIENRKIIVRSSANMSKAANEREQCARAIQRILREHPTDRVLVHCVSYDLADDLRSQLDGTRPCLSYRDAYQREKILAKFRRTPNAVLFAPSLDRGVDLKDDDCRVVIVAKVPYPYLGDRQVSARLHTFGGDQWYAIQTVRTLVQMTGRATRHAEDYSTTYILDSQFKDSLWFRARSLFPSWWKDALIWHEGRREPALSTD